MSGTGPHAEYHADIDILQVRLCDAEVVRTRELDVWRNVDLSADGRPVAVEFVNASRGVDLRGVPMRAEVEPLVRAFGLPVVV
jgi:hypothetical protein